MIIEAAMGHILNRFLKKHKFTQNHLFIPVNDGRRAFCIMFWSCYFTSFHIEHDITKHWALMRQWWKQVYIKERIMWSLTVKWRSSPEPRLSSPDLSLTPGIKRHDEGGRHRWPLHRRADKQRLSWQQQPRRDSKQLCWLNIIDTLIWI